MIDEKLKNFLDSEVDDYDMSYEIESVDFTEDKPEFYATVKVKRWENEIDVCFRVKNGELQIELSEDCWYNIREFDWTVKYFWMLVSPALFPRGE